jgi:hypothetical protein
MKNLNLEVAAIYEWDGDVDPIAYVLHPADITGEVISIVNAARDSAKEDDDLALASREEFYDYLEKNLPPNCCIVGTPWTFTLFE